MKPEKGFIRRNWLLLGVAVGFYICAMIYLSFFQRSMMYFPGGVRPDVEALELASRPQILNVTTRDGLNISGWYWPAREGKLTIVYFHGNAQDYSYWLDKAMTYHALGYGFVLAEYRGFGGNEGAPSEVGLILDGKAYVDTLFQRFNLIPQDIVFMGQSLGTGVAVQMASAYPVRGLVLEAAYTSTAEVAKLQYWMFPIDLLMRDQYRSLDYIGQLSMPMLLIHGKLDTTIPIFMGFELYNAIKAPKTFVMIDDAEHNNLYSKGAGDKVVEFLRKLEN